MAKLYCYKFKYSSPKKFIKGYEPLLAHIVYVRTIFKCIIKHLDCFFNFSL